MGISHGRRPGVRSLRGAAMTLSLTFDVPRELWMSSNRPIAHHGHRKRIIDHLHALAAGTAVAARLSPVTGPYLANWTIRYPKGVRRDKGDAANAHPTTKALLDGLVPRWLEDDGPLHVVTESFTRGANLDVTGFHAVRLVLTPQTVPWGGDAA